MATHLKQRSGEGMMINTVVPPLIRSPYLPKNYGHIREVAFGERENSSCIYSSSDIWFVATLERVAFVESH